MNKTLVDSNVKWIGKIPSDWDIKPLGTYLKERKEKVSDIDYEPLSVTKNGIVPQLENAAKTDAHDSRKKVCKGDFVINSRSDRKQSCGLSDYEGSVSLINIVLENNKYFPKYLKYLLDNNMFAEEFYSNGHGIVADLWTTRYEEMKKILLPVPSIEEQKKIANYLDDKVAKLNEVIDNNRNEISLLEEYKNSTINEFITKGINRKCNYKKTNVEWVESIPETWEEIKLKNKIYVRARLGWKGLKAEEYVEHGYPLLSAFNIINSKLDFSEVNYINKFRYDESPEIKLNIGDILLVKDGAGIGKCAYVENLPTESTVNGSIALLTCSNDLNGKYLYYYFLSPIFQKYIYRIKDGMGVPHLFQRDIRKINLALPPIDEQNVICKKLDNICEKINDVITYRKNIIEKLEEYKKSLIYEAITGKIEV